MPDSLRLILLSGDWIPTDLPGAAWKISPSLEIVSLGGATEASIWSILNPVSRADCEKPSIPYGLSDSMTGQRLFVVKPDFSLCEVEEEGELVIEGLGLARCYWNSPERTEESFIDHPDLGRVYRTGDMGRLGSDGRIIFLGRRDQQVKVSGFRIDLSEIESKIAQLDLVDEVAVVVCTEDARGPYIVAWVVTSLETEEIRKHLQEQLPGSSVPRFIKSLSSLPRGAQQKIDRVSLACWNAVEKTPSEEPPVACTTRGHLIRVWRDALGLPSVDDSTHFFRAGGASFAALEATLEAEKAFSFELQPHLLYDFPVFGDYLRRLTLDPRQDVERGDPELSVRSPRIEDACAFMALEQKTPDELCLDELQLKSCWRIFPEGQWIVVRDGQILAQLGGFRAVSGDPGQATWWELTDGGTFGLHQPDGNCYYVSDLKTDPAWNGVPLLPLLWDEFLGYLEKHPEITEIRSAVALSHFPRGSSRPSLSKYLSDVHNGAVSEPLLKAYLGLGAEPGQLVMDYLNEAPIPKPHLNLRFDCSAGSRFRKRARFVEF